VLFNYSKKGAQPCLRRAVFSSYVKLNNGNRAFWAYDEGKLKCFLVSRCGWLAVVSPELQVRMCPHKHIVAPPQKVPTPSFVPRPLRIKNPRLH
jgi:hypothetical protein